MTSRRHASARKFSTRGSVTKRFGAMTAVDAVDFTLREHEVAGIIGSNGAGKTTFFNLLTGYYAPDDGVILHKGDDITRTTPAERVARGVTRTFQLTSTFDNLSVNDNLVARILQGPSQIVAVAPAARSPCRETPR